MAGRRHDRDICKLQKSLPPITMAQANWILGQDKERSRREYASQTGRKRKVVHYEYFTILTTHKGWQVVRHFLVHSEYSTKKGYWPDYLQEVHQEWMRHDDNGRLSLEIFQLKHAMTWYRNSQPYSLNSPLSLKCYRCDHNRGGCDYFGAGDAYIYPVRKILPTMNANGLGGYVGRMDGLALYQSVHGYGNYDKSFLAENDAYREAHKGDDEYRALHIIERCYLPQKVETLYKMGENALAMLMLGRNFRVYRLERYWKFFLVARRHGLRLHGEDEACQWLDYVADLEALGKDIHSPKYLVPADLGKAHGKVIDKLTELRRRTADEIARRTRVEDNAGYLERMSGFFGLSMTAKNLHINPLKSVDEFEDEGNAMHHCVYSCGYYKPTHNCLILSARDDDGRRIETIEVSLDGFTIMQSRGVCNRPTERHDEIVNLVNANMDAIRRIAESRVAA